MEYINIPDIVKRHNKTLKPPPPIIVYEDLKNQNINIFDESYRAYLFENCRNCEINIQCKTLKVLFVDCIGNHISINKDMIGSLELLRCMNLQIEMKANIPLVQEDLCSKIIFYQHHHKMLYVCSASMDIIAILNQEKINIPCNMFTNQCFVVVEGTEIKPYHTSYLLNSIQTHHFNL